MEKYFLVLLLFIFSCQNKTDKPVVEHLIPGQEVFQSNCSACHGDLGNAMISGAKDLTQSHLNQQEIMLIIKKGKGNMLAYESILTEEEINDLSHYVLSLRTP